MVVLALRISGGTGKSPVGKNPSSTVADAFGWESAPEVLGTLLRQLFHEQPDDALSWLHAAVWNLHSQELLACKLRISGKDPEPFIAESSYTCGKRAEELSQEEVVHSVATPVERLAAIAKRSSPGRGQRLPKVPQASASDFSDFDAPLPDERVPCDFEFEDVPDGGVHATIHASSAPDLNTIGMPYTLDRRCEGPPCLGGSSASSAEESSAVGPLDLVLSPRPEDRRKQIWRADPEGSVAAAVLASCSSNARTWRVPRADESWMMHFAHTVCNLAMSTDSMVGTSTGSHRRRAVKMGILRRLWWPCTAIAPFNIALAVWDFIICTLVILEIWGAIFLVAFLPDGSGPAQWCIRSYIALLAAFTADIVLGAMTGFVTSRGDQLVLGVAAAARHYAQTWLCVDSSATLCGVAWVTLGYHPLVQASALLRSTRVLRAWRRLSMAKRFWELSLQLDLWIEYCNLQLLLALSAHVLAAAWALFEPSEGGDGPDLYIRAMAFAYSELALGGGVISSGGLGFGRNALVVVAAALRPLLWGFVLSRFARVLLRAWQPGAARGATAPRHTLALLGKYGITAPVRVQVLWHMREREKTLRDRRHFEALEVEPLPGDLLAQIHHELWCVPLETLGLIREVASWYKEFTVELSTHVQGQFLAPAAVLYSRGDPSLCAYFVQSGILAVLDCETTEPSEDFKGGMWVGERALVNPDLRRRETVACVDRAALMAVPSSAFQEVLTKLDLVEPFRELLEQRLWLGLCGRCGAFGHHFSKQCPTLAQPMRSSLRRSLSKASGFATESETSHVQVEPKELRVFLRSRNMESLLGPLIERGITSLDDLTPEKVERFLHEAESELLPGEKAFMKDVTRDGVVRSFRRRRRRKASSLLASAGDRDNHLIFISHYKLEAGTEAALMQQELETLIRVDQSALGNRLHAPVFVDSEDLRSLLDLENHVRRSHNLMVLLTPGVLTRAWVLTEIHAAFRCGVNLVPVHIQRADQSFKYPDESYYRRLRAGEELDEETQDFLESEGVQLANLEEAIRHLFKSIAMPFSPHKSAVIREAELRALLNACRLRDALAHLVNPPRQAKRVEASRRLPLRRSHGPSEETA